VHGRPIKPVADGTPLPSDFFEARCVGSDGAARFRSAADTQLLTSSASSRHESSTP